MSTKYLLDPNQNGWILTVPDGTDPSAVGHNPNLGLSLPWCLKVDLLKNENGREYFQILEGSLKGSRASVKVGAGNKSYLTSENLQKIGGSLRLNRKKQDLWYGAKGPFSAFSELSNPVPVGIHDLEIPDFPHPDYYPESSKYQLVWFRVGHSGDRYLHLGTI